MKRLGAGCCRCQNSLKTNSQKKNRLRIIKIQPVALEVSKLQNAGGWRGILGGYHYMLYLDRTSKCEASGLATCRG